MKLSPQSFCFLLLPFIIPSAVLANCLLPPPLAAKIKIVTCEEEKPGEIFIFGELLDVKRTTEPVVDSLRFPTPKVGTRFHFYKGLSPLKKDFWGNLKPRDIGFCKSHGPGSEIAGNITSPCCDATYPWCDPKRNVEFLIDEGKG